MKEFRPIYDPPRNDFEQLMNEIDKLSHAVRMAQGQRGVMIPVRFETGPYNIRRLVIAINNRLYNELRFLCECGGKGPADPDACPICRAWHRIVRTVPNPEGKKDDGRNG